MRHLDLAGNAAHRFGTVVFLLCVLSLIVAGARQAWASESPAAPVIQSCDGSSVNALVWDFEVFDDDLIVAGAFTTVGPLTAGRIARWDGTGWSQMGSGMNDAVYTLIPFNGDLIAGGWFTQAGGVPAYYIARWDGSAWQPLGQGLGGPVRALAVYEGDLIVGGDFTTAGGQLAKRIARWNGSSWSTMGGGFSDGIPSTFGVRALAIHNGVLVAGGFFTRADGQSCPYIAQWTGSAWVPLGVWTHGGVYSLLSTTSGLVAGSVVMQEGTGDWEDMIARWNGTAWEPLGVGPLPPPFGAGIRALTEYQGQVIAAGRFSMAGGVTIADIAAWNGGAWVPLGAGISTTGTVYALHNFAGKLVAGGDFTVAGGQPIPYQAQWDGTSWSCLGAVPVPPVTLVAPPAVEPLQEFSVTVAIGSQAAPVNELFGMTGKLHLSDPTDLEILRVECQDSLGSPLGLGTDVICFGHVDNEAGVASWGVSRKAPAPGVSGALDVVRIVLRFGPDFPGGTVCRQLSLTDVSAVDALGAVLNLSLPGSSTVCAGSVCAVWPGDTNNDGMVGEQDVIALGLRWGASGTARSSPGCTWAAKSANCWAPIEATFADAFGDGEVGEEDVLCIGLNWGAAHSLAPGSVPFALPPDFDLAARLPALQAMYSYVRGHGDASSGMLALEKALERLITTANAPRATALYQNEPNPFNPETTIRFDLVRPGRVSLRIYDVAGQFVRALVDTEMPAGRSHVVWDARDERGLPVTSGLYLYRLVADEMTVTRKMIVLK